MKKFVIKIEKKDDPISKCKQMMQRLISGKTNFQEVEQAIGIALPADYSCGRTDVHVWIYNQDRVRVAIIK